MFTLMLLSALGPPDVDAVKETCRISGEWRLQGTGDARRQEAGSDLIRMTVGDDGVVVFTFQGTTTNRGVFRILPGTRTMRADLTFKDGRTYELVFTLKDDVLTLCFDEHGKGRPSAVVPQGTQWIEHWKKVTR